MALTELHRDQPPAELHEGKRHKANVRAASTANVNTASPGTTLDGVTLSAGDRILLKNQSTASQNGIYTWSASGSALVRATDADAAAELFKGFLVYVEEGTANAATVWAHTTTAAITLGTTALTFAQVGSGTHTHAESDVTSLTADLAAKAPLASPTFTGVPATPALAVSGLTGAVSASRYVGATASVAPTTGTFTAGDWVVTLTGKIYVCTTGGSPGTWTQVGAGGAASMTIQEVDGTPSVSATTLILPNGTLVDNGGGSVTYTPAGGGSLTSAMNQLSADVTMTTGGTYYDGPSLSLGAGTWLLTASVAWDGNGNAFKASAKLWDGTTVAASAQVVNRGTASEPQQIPLTAVVTLGSTATWKVSVVSNVGSTVIRAATPYSGAGNNASTLTAVKIA
jgi:hypothetical protein